MYVYRSSKSLAATLGAGTFIATTELSHTASPSTTTCVVVTLGAFRLQVGWPARGFCATRGATRHTRRVPFRVEMIEFDLNGRRLILEEATVQELRIAALAGAGSSTTLNDLAVILSRALSDPKVITLRRAESRALEHLLDSNNA